MMIKLRTLSLFGIFFLSFTMGNMVGLSLGNDDIRQNQIPFTINPQAQKNILLISVDRLDIPTPKLEAVWLILVTPPQPTLSLIPIYPTNLEFEEKTAKQLTKNFSLTPAISLDNSFKNALREQDIKWDHLIIFDENGWVDIAALVGSNNFGSGWLNKETVNLSFAITHDDPHTALLRQAFILNQFCSELSSLNLISHLKFLFDSNHARTDITSSQIFDALYDYQNQGVNLTCKFPTLD